MINADNADKTQTISSASVTIVAQWIKSLTQTVDTPQAPSADWFKGMGGVSTCLR